MFYFVSAMLFKLNVRLAFSVSSVKALAHVYRENLTIPMKSHLILVDIFGFGDSLTLAIRSPSISAGEGGMQ